MSFRAFISADIEPTEPLVGLLNELANSRADLKIVKPHLLHVTLKFLGDTQEDIVGRIAECMESSAHGVAPFDIRLEGMGAFPSMSNARVVWVGIKEWSCLAEISSKLDAALDTLGFDRDKKGFVPHLTLARARSGRNMANVQDILKAHTATEYGTYRVDRILLKKSVLSPQGPTYSIVREVLLEGR